MTDRPIVTADADWYKDAVIYEVHVRAFGDSNADGIGDFPGLTRRLGHIQDLGITTVWLLPFYPSPLRDDGYDIADYTSIHADYGTLDDFRRFLEEAHRRGLRVITELVVNHTSDQHPWFQRARRAAPGSPERDFYVWSDTPDRYPDARIIFKDTESSNWAWDPVAQAYYWHRFFSHQPDLNYDNPAVVAAVTDAMDFWLKMGVDGLRLDAVPYLFEEEGTMCENLPATHAELKRLRRHVDDNYENRMLLAEANQWPEDAISYFGDGDECHMAFHFPLMPRLFMAISMENRFPLIDILEQTPPIPPSAQWAIFLRNHDELTLEMVTDEERDYMYRTYARDRTARLNLGIRRRLAPLLQNNRREIELMNALLLSLPGTPVVYYGDEIGMGDNIYLGDRNGVRTPMQWSSDRNAGFSQANPQRLYLPIIIDPEYHYETVNVEAQLRNPNSMLWWTRRMIALRKRHEVFGRGNIEFLHPENNRVLAFLRRLDHETVLVVANLSRHNQFVELDLSAFEGSHLRELFGNSLFPAVGELPYLLTLGPHAYYWFVVESAEQPSGIVAGRLDLEGPLAALPPPALQRLGEILARYLPGREWYQGRGRNLRALTITDVVPLTGLDAEAVLVVATADFYDTEPQRYVMTLGVALGEERARLEASSGDGVIAPVMRAGVSGLLYDPLMDPAFDVQLLGATVTEQSYPGMEGSAVTAHLLGRPLAEKPTGLEPAMSDSPDGHTTITFGQRWALKIFRYLEPGLNPDLEVRRFLTGRTAFTHLPPVEGWSEYRLPGDEPATLAILQTFMLHEGDGWHLFRSSLGRFYERLLTSPESDLPPLEHPPGYLFDLVGVEPPDALGELIDADLQSAEVLGRRTAGLHLALASDTEDPDFRPERLSTLAQRSLYQSIRSALRQGLGHARRRLPELPDRSRDEVAQVVAREDELLALLGLLLENRFGGRRIRIHGDFRLEQVLSTGRDFIVYDFQGDTTRPITERRLKRSPLVDVAGMIRSLHYVSAVALDEQAELIGIPIGDLGAANAWAEVWHAWASAAFLSGYLADMDASGLLPGEPDQRRALLQVHLIDRAARELRWEIDNRPLLARIPALGLMELLGPVF